MPAQKKSRRSRIKNQRSKKSHKKKSNKNKKYLLALLVILFIFLFFKLSGGDWDGKSKLSMATSQDSGEVVIINFDPQSEKITRVSIPANTQVDVARNLGVLRLKNVWRLGKDEGLGGNLMAETITRSLNLPVYLWAGDGGYYLSERSIVKIIRSFVIPYSDNIPLADKVRLAVFSLSTDETGRDNFDLADMGALDNTTLADGEDGFVISSRVSSKLASIFSDDYVSTSQLSVSIVDATGVYGVASGVGATIEALGAKTAVVQKRSESDFDCEIAANDKLALGIINKYLNCEVINEGSGFDLEITLGSRFAERF